MNTIHGVPLWLILQNQIAPGRNPFLYRISTRIEFTPDGTEEVTNLAPEPATDASFLTIDDQFAQIARDIDGFGGLFLDESGQLNIFLKDPDTQLDHAVLVQRELEF